MTTKKTDTKKMEDYYRKNFQKFMDFLDVFQGKEYTRVELAKMTGLTVGGVKHRLDKLMEIGLIGQEKNDGDLAHIFFALKEKISFDEYVELFNYDFEKLSKESREKALKARAGKPTIEGARIFLMDRSLLVEKKAQAEFLRKEAKKKRPATYMGSSLA
jgi:predicted transcriptional regulator